MYGKREIPAEQELQLNSVICDYPKEQLFATRELFSNQNMKNSNHPKPEDTQEDGSV